MFFVPQEKAKKTLEECLKRSTERKEKASRERRKKYKEMIERGEL